MNTPLWHLAWKEYRFTRAFWIAIVGLVVAAQALFLWWSRIEQFGDDWIALVVCNIALGAPVFFALGAAGAAFAVEREEGTYDFLRAAPLSAAQVFGTKLGTTALATVAMFAVLWPVALWFTGGHLPQRDVLGGMLGLWLLAAAEAIAWGTLFSLLTARPLVAVCLALVAASTTTHLFGMAMSQGAAYEFEFAHYLQAALWRGLIAAALLAADVYLGLRWLDEPRSVAKRTIPKPPADRSIAANALAARVDRATICGRLLWQHFRQSGRLMLVMGGLQIALVWLTFSSGLIVERQQVSLLPILPVAGMAAIMGSCVFLADQERRNFRFFVEHNVPPRYVWLTRQLPWIVALVVSWVAACVISIRSDQVVYLARFLWGTINEADLRWQLQQAASLWTFVMFGAAGITLCYAAGQYTSMMMRSGLLAAVLGVLLAGALCLWALLMLYLQVNWPWSVLPLPLVLLWATWLRAPDWVRENNTWLARVKAAAAVLAPAAALLMYVPYHRVHEVPLVDPGFDVAAYEASIADDGLQTAALYRRANELFVPLRAVEGNGSRFEAWLGQNAESLELVLKAAAQPSCLLNDPRKPSSAPGVYHADHLVALLNTSARQLQSEGQLDQALDRYFTTLRVISQWSEHNATQLAIFSPSPADQAATVLDEIMNWGAAAGQTAERLRAAIQRVSELPKDLLHADERLQASYLLMRPMILGDHAAAQALFGLQADNPGFTTRMFVVDRLLPWEKYRELRSLHRYMESALGGLRDFEGRLQAGLDVAAWLPPDHTHNYYGWRRDTLLSIAPVIGDFKQTLTFELAKLETWRRATLIVLALEAYRLDHGELPQALDALVGPYLDKLPVDPYSGLNFVYFREGLPQPATDADRKRLEEIRYSGRPRSSIEPGVPCIWSTSAMLATEIELPQPNEPDGAATVERTKPLTMYCLRFGGRPPQPADFSVWSEGHWFPIPSAGKEQAEVKPPGPPAAEADE